MMKKTSLSVIGTFILALSVIPAAQAYDIKDNSGYYSFTGPSHRSVILTYFSLENNLDAYSGDVDIPASISYMTNDIPVKGVGDRALFNCQGVTSVKLPEGLTYILDQAFSHCYAMRSLTLPSTLELIKDYAFEYCDDLTSVTIPAKVSEFGYAVFSNCLGLKEIKVEEGNTILEDQDGILYMKGGELLVQYPAGRPDQVFVIPQSVSVITDYAFSPAPSLVSVEIGDKVTEIAPLTFLECGNLEQITVSTSNPYLTSEEGVLYDKNKTRILQFPRANRTEDLILPSTLTVIEDLAFSQAQNLRNVTFPSSLSAIGTYAFLGSLPESITSLAPTPPSVGSMAFDETIYSLTTLYVPAEAIDKYKKAASWKAFANIEPISPVAVTDVEAEELIRIDGNVAYVDGNAEIRVYSAVGTLITTGYGKVSLPQNEISIILSKGKRIKFIP